MKQDKKSLIRFLLLMSVCSVFGGICGYMMAAYDQSAKDILNGLMMLIYRVSIPLSFCGALMLAAGVIAYYKGCQKMELSLKDIDNDDLLDQADGTLTFATICVSQAPLLTMVFYGVTMPGAVQNIDLTPWPLFLAQTIVFILVLLISVVYQVKTIEAVKKLYPEKKGNVLDTKFVKDWFNSCDEAERQKIGEASYFAYRMMSMTALGLLIISILISSTLQLGPFPTLAIGVMMFVGTFSYLYKCRTLEKGKRL